VPKVNGRWSGATGLATMFEDLSDDPTPGGVFGWSHPGVIRWDHYLGAAG